MQPAQNVCILVHNVSHSDFFVSYFSKYAANDPTAPEDLAPPFARPRFSMYNPVSQAALKYISSSPAMSVLTHPTDEGNELEVGFSFGTFVPSWIDSQLTH